MSPKKVRWGILGTSFISEVMVKAIRESENGHVMAVAGRTASKVSSFVAEHDIHKFYDDYQSILNDNDIDAVYIGLPNHLHKEWMIRAALAGKHILCEKPFTTSELESQEVIAAIHEHKVFCMEAIMYRCHPFIDQLRGLIQENSIGDIRLIKACYNAKIADLANPVEGGAIRNLGCYPLSLTRFILDSEPKEIRAMGRINPKTGTDSQSSAVMIFDKNILVNVSTADDLEMSWQFDIYGTEGTLKVLTNPWLPDLNNKIEIHRHLDLEPVEMSFSGDRSLYTYQIDLANACIRTNTLTNHQGVSLEESLGNTRALEEWRRQVVLSP